MLPPEPDPTELRDCDLERNTPSLPLPSTKFSCSTAFRLISFIKNSFLSSSIPPQILNALTRRSKSVNASVVDSGSSTSRLRLLSAGETRRSLRNFDGIRGKIRLGVAGSESSAKVESATSLPTLNTRIRCPCRRESEDDGRFGLRRESIALCLLRRSAAVYGLSTLNRDSDDEECVLDRDRSRAGDRAGERIYMGAKRREVYWFRNENAGFRI